jgi:hypothetical protein
VPATLATSALEASPWVRRGSWARTRLCLADAHQQVAPTVMRTAITDTVEILYNQAGPTGRPHAAEGFSRCSVRAMTPAHTLIWGAG